jgi:hypothetical protein
MPPCECSRMLRGFSDGGLQLLGAGGADRKSKKRQWPTAVTLEPITSEQATNGQRLLLIPGRASKLPKR